MLEWPQIARYALFYLIDPALQLLACMIALACIDRFKLRAVYRRHCFGK